MTADGETSAPDRDARRRNPRRSAAKAKLQPIVGGKRQRLEDVNVLLDVAQRISGTETLDEILEELVEMTSAALGCDRSSFFLYDADTNELYSRVAQGIRRREIRLLSNDGIIGAAFQSGGSIIVDDAYADPRFTATIDQETGYVTKTILCVPLRTAKGDVVGVAQALNKLGGVFSERERALLEAIAAQSIPALRSSQAVERMEKARAQELAFLDIVADITSQIDLDQLLQRVMNEAARMLGAERSTLFLHDDKTGELFSRVAMGAAIGEIRFPNHAGIAGTVFTT
jgi:adenylate cyclase